MDIVFAIAHAADQDAGKDPKPRLAALARQLLAVRQLYSGAQCMLRHADRTAIPAGRGLAGEVRILVLTAGDRHLLDKLPAPKGFYEHVPVDEDPAMLGFACRDALARHVGRADYFCYLEHDLIPHDPLLFLKLGWFTRYAGNIAVLLPQRFELTRRGPFRKVYVDGDLVPEATADFQDASEQAELHARVMDEHIVFRRALNPYAGCWFLNAAQMEHWTSQPYFADRDASFLGPMQSAAALGLMRTFRVYKAAPEHAGFLEVERFASEYSPQIGKSVKVAEGPPAPEDTK